MEKRLKVGEIVWAKIRGFPWWPGMIGKIEESTVQSQETKVLVNFIGDPTHAEIPISKIEKFEKKYEEFSKTKKRALIDSIVLAKKILSGEITFNNHLNYHNNIIKKKGIKNKKVEESENSESEDTTKKNKKILHNKRKRKESTSGDTELAESGRTKSTAISEKETVKKPKNNNINEDRRVYKRPNCSKRQVVEQHDSSEEEEESSEKDKAEQLTQLIRNLALFKIELPSSTSNKSIISSLDETYDIIENFEGENFYDVIKGFNSFLVCLATHKNQTVSTKATSLNNLVQQKLLKFLFETPHKEIKLQKEYSIAEKIDEQELLGLLNLAPIPKIDFPKKTIPKAFPKRKGTKDSFLMYKDDFDKHSKDFMTLKLSMNKEEESNILTEMSLNSDKTDCDDNKQKQRLAITPLEKKHIYAILSDYFSDFKVANEEDFHDGLTNGDYFSCLDTNKLSKPVKHHYMRRRVCIKLFKVFEKLCKNLHMEHEIIKNLSIYLEMKARDGDPEMTEKYRVFVSSIFNRIKEKLIMATLPLINNEEEV